MAKKNAVPDSMRIKLNIVLVLLTIVGFGILVGRLYVLQIRDGDKYRTLALKQQLQPTQIAAQRGTIYDRTKKTLAASATVWTVTLSPAEVEDDKQLESIADFLSETLDVDRDEIITRGQKKQSYYEVIKQKVEQDVADKITEYCKVNEINCINLEQSSRRYYPYGSLASTVLGFTGSEGKGAYGIESYYEKLLAGTDGMIVSVKNAKAGDMPDSEEQRYEAVDGSSLVLTIDSVVQESLEKHVAAAVKEHNVQNKAVGIVMNVKTGEILGMTTQPDFDPNEPNTIADETVLAEIEAITDEDEKAEATQQAQFSQWRNKAVSDAYEPGSVFKPITASMALETGTATPYGSYYDCTGSYTVAGRAKKCWKTAGHGLISFTQAVMYSCNPAFMMIGQSVGAEAFQNYFEAFGLNEATGVDLPGEAEGTFYSDLVAYDAQSAEYLASSSFGQTFTVTPLQMLTAICAVVNGGTLYEPYVVSQVLDAQGNVVSTTEPTAKRQVISAETSETMCEILEKVVGTSDGSGKKAYIPGYRVGGKTGTSEKLSSDGEGGYVVSFVGIAPMDDPQYAVLVTLDEPIVSNIYGSVIAAPVVGAIMTDILPYLGVEPVYTEEEAAVTDVEVPYVTGSNMHDAISTLTRSQLAYKTVGSGVTVTRQSPGAAEVCPKGTTVTLYLGEDATVTTAEVPDVRGMSLPEANRTIQNAGFNIRTEGDTSSDGAIAVSQEPAGGSACETGTVVTVTFSVISRETAENTKVE